MGTAKSAWTLTAVAFATALGGAAPAGAVTVSTPWNLTYTRSWGGQESYIASTVDSAGNTTVLYEHNDFYTLARLSAAGTLASAMPFTKPPDVDIAAIAVDGSGNLVIAGRMSVAFQQDLYVGRFSPAGAQLWGKTYDSGLNDEAIAVAVDAAGAILVLDHRWSSTGSGSDGVLVRYTTLGLVQGTATIDYTTNDQPRGLAVDASGSVYVCGGLWNGVDGAWLEKYNAGPLSATPVWSRTFTTGASGIAGYHVAVQPGAATVFISVVDNSSLAVGLVQFDGGGEPSTSVWYSSGTDPLDPADLAVDAAGRATMALHTCCDAGGVGDALLLRYPAAMTSPTVVRWDTGGKDGDGLPDPRIHMGLDVAGDAYVAMMVSGGTTDCWLHSDVAARKYAGGTPAWTANFDGPASTDGGAAAADPAGFLYVGGRFAQDSFLKKIGPDGAVLWTVYPDYPNYCYVSVDQQAVAHNALTVYFATSVTRTSNNNAELAIDKRSAATGAQTALVTWNGIPNVRRPAVTVDANANVYVAMPYSDNSGTFSVDSMVLLAFNGSNQLLWSRSSVLGPLDDPQFIAQDGQGGVYVHASYGQSPDGRYAITKYDAAGGTLVWQRTLTGGFDQVLPGGMTFTGGHLVVAGSDILGSLAQARGRLYALTPAGDVLWTRTYTFGDNAGFLSVAADANGRLYAGGVAYPPGVPAYDTVAVAFEADGTVRWSQRYDSLGLDITMGALPGAGGVYLPCHSGDDLRVIRYVEAGGGSAGALHRFDRPAAAYPNPVSGDTLNVALHLGGAATRVVVEMFNASWQRVYEGDWRDVSVADGGVTLTGLAKLAPGRYLIRARAELADGTTKTFEPVKIVVKR